MDGLVTYLLLAAELSASELWRTSSFAPDPLRPFAFFSFLISSKNNHYLLGSSTKIY